MHKFALFTLLIGVLVGCQPAGQPAQSITQPVVQLEDQGFDLGLEIVETNGKQASLNVSLKMDEDSYVISSYSTDDIYGHFEISLTESPHLFGGNPMAEIPASVEEFDPVIKQSVRFIRQETTFQQPLEVLSEDDFVAEGKIEFVLEPRCVPYDVTFTISQQDGKLKVVKTKTSISREYKI
ncbi:MAG: hypothetical protein AAFV07_15405 [Bacteroidota bacterium]